VCLDKATGRELWRRQSHVEGPRVRSSPWDGSPTGPWVGYTFATPVTDGERLWIKSGTGATACYDLDGRRLWLARTKYPVGGNVALVSSPVLVGDPSAGTGRLVLQVITEKIRQEEEAETLGLAVEAKPQAPAGADQMVAYDALTGEVAWTAPCSVPSASSSPVVMRLTDGRQDMQVVVTDGGTVVRADDGKVLVHRMPGTAGNGTGTPVADVLYRFGAKYQIGTATQMVMLSRDVVGGRRLWTTPGGACAGGWSFADGLLYSVRGSQFGGPYAIVDPSTGREIPRRVNVGVSGVGVFTPGRRDAYVPCATTRDFVFLAHRGERDRSDPWAHVTVAQAGPDGRFVAHNRMDLFLTPPPVFDGDLTFIRTDKFLTCIGHTGDAGRAYEAEENARRILDDLPPEPPPRVEAKAVAPDDPSARGRRPFDYGPVDLGRCVFLGPFPPGAGDEALSALGGPAEARLAEGAEVTAGRVVRAARELTKAERGERAVNVRGKPTLDVLRAAGGEAPNVCLFATTVTTNRPRTVRLLVEEGDVRAWLAGAPMAHGDRARLQPGAYRLLLAVKVTREGAAPLVRFADSDDQDAEVRRWHDSVARNRPIFERLVHFRPESDLASRARTLLDRPKGGQ